MGAIIGVVTFLIFNVEKLLLFGENEEGTQKIYLIFNMIKCRNNYFQGSELINRKSTKEHYIYNVLLMYSDAW